MNIWGKKCPAPPLPKKKKKIYCLGLLRVKLLQTLYSSVTVSMSALTCEESFISTTPKVVMHGLKKNEGFDLF